jgi:hypothetical protein
MGFRPFQNQRQRLQSTSLIKVFLEFADRMLHVKVFSTVSYEDQFIHFHIYFDEDSSFSASRTVS